jgi:hypothetical protein
MRFDDLASAPIPPKVKRVSVVTSTLRSTSGHAVRNRFLERLSRHRIARFIDFYGGGRRLIEDKWDAIAPYKYHLALENSSRLHYWTEKLADAFLGYSLPIYWGCRNIGDFFATESVIPLDLLRTSQAVETVERVLDEDPYEVRLESVLESRARVLTDYNLLMWIADFCHEPSGRPRETILEPRALFLRRGPSSIAWRSRHAISRVTRSTLLGRQGLSRWRP